MAKKNSRNSARVLVKKSNFRFRWWMGVVIVIIIAVVGLVVLRFSRASTPNTPAPTGPIYWVGDSLSTLMLRDGNLKADLETNGYSPAYVNANPGRSITAGGFEINPVTHEHQSGEQAVVADNKNVCPGNTDPSIQAYCASHGQNYNPVASAKTIVVFLGSNPEESTDSFISLQNRMLSKLKQINPNARYVWADIAAPGNLELSTNQAAIDFANLGGQKVTKQDLEKSFVETHQRLNKNQNTIYTNNIDPLTSNEKYSILSQFRFIWGTNTNPVSQFVSITNQFDCHGFVADGTHYTTQGSIELAKYLSNSLKKGNFASNSPSNSPSVCGMTPLPMAATYPTVKQGVGDITMNLPVYNLFSAADQLYSQQDPQVYVGDPQTTAEKNLDPTKQCPSFSYKTTTINGCLLNKATTLHIISNKFASPSDTRTKQVCIRGQSSSGQTVKVNLSTQLVPLKAAPTAATKLGTILNSSLTFSSVVSEQCAPLLTGQSVNFAQLGLRQTEGDDLFIVYSIAIKTK